MIIMIMMVLVTFLVLRLPLGASLWAAFTLRHTWRWCALCFPYVFHPRKQILQVLRLLASPAIFCSFLFPLSVILSRPASATLFSCNLVRVFTFVFSIYSLTPFRPSHSPDHIGSVPKVDQSIPAIKALASNHHLPIPVTAYAYQSYTHHIPSLTGLCATIANLERTRAIHSTTASGILSLDFQSP